jgi:tetratricopeptide (TPR) repeat protein
MFSNYEAANAHARKALELDPAMSFAYANLAHNFIQIGRLDDSAKVLAQAAAKKLYTLEIDEDRYALAFLRGDETAMQAVIDASKGSPEVEEFLNSLHAKTQALHGRVAREHALMERARAITEQGGHREVTAELFAVEAVLNGFFGDKTAARTGALKALGISKGREVGYSAGLALALAGDRKAAQAIAEELAARHPEDTFVQFSYVPVIRAQLALDAGDPAQALEALSGTHPTELGPVRSLIGALYPCYFRGQALLALGRRAEAAAEFQKILDHPGVVLNDPIGASARLQLARALRVAGDTLKAKDAYRSLLDLWQQADPGIRLLAEVKREAAAL